MKESSEKEQEAMLEVLKRHEQELKAFSGVHYIDVGYKFVDGQPTEELAIRVHVGEKKLEKELEATQILPSTIEGIPIDVIQSNPGLEQDRDDRFNPLVGGVAVKNTRHNFFGTLGVVVFDAASRVPMALSNHHVLVGQGGQAGDRIAQPASQIPNDVIGTLARWNIDLDCAVCTLNDSRPFSRGIVDYPQGITGVLQPVIGTRVTKSGRTTETTFGIIDGVSTTEFTVIPDPQRPSPGGEISAGGDSGSVWLQVETNRVIGLHFAGETDPSPSAERAWAKRIVSVMNALNIVFEA